MKIKPSDFKLFEDWVRDTIKRRFPARQGWKIGYKKTLTSGHEPDFVVYKRNERIVIDAKDKAELTRRDINQIVEDRGECNAQYGIIYIANDTYVSNSVRLYADDFKIKISRTRWRKK